VQQINSVAPRRTDNHLDCGSFLGQFSNGKAGAIKLAPGCSIASRIMLAIEAKSEKE